MHLILNLIFTSSTRSTTEQVPTMELKLNSNIKFKSVIKATKFDNLELELDEFRQISQIKHQN